MGYIEEERLRRATLQLPTMPMESIYHKIL